MNIENQQEQQPNQDYEPIQWEHCRRCGTSVDTTLIDPDGHHYAADGTFYCEDCWASGQVG